MENLRQEFLDEAVSNLENLSSKLSTEPLGENFLREIFRTFHTLKGTSQTFNFNVSGKLAHDLENLLQAFKERKTAPEKKFILLLREGTEILCETFRRARAGLENHFPDQFAQKLRSLIPDYSESAAENFLDDIPSNILKQLSAQEKKLLSAAMADGRKFYAVEVGFDLADFDVKFRSLRELLEIHGGIIATFPRTAFSEKNKIGFQIFFVSRKDKNEIAEITKSFDVNLLSDDFGMNFNGDLQGVLAQAVLAGEKTARRLDKEIEFEILTDDSEISGNRLKLFSEVLLHLIRNAVDHAIEKNGKIKIELLSKKNVLLLRVSDDGRGLDPEKIRARASEKNLIAADEILTRDKAFDLIFAHGFSTAESVSEISGRGVGLDVVKDSIEKANGKIRVESATGKGTVFEIRLPQDEKILEK